MVEEKTDLFGGVEKAPTPAHVGKSTGNNEWYTPEKYIYAASEVMDGIYLDPASSEIANRKIKAMNYFTEKDDGLVKDWRGTVWMNPPFAQPLVRLFCEKLIYHFEGGDITQACVLINNGTETRHGQLMLNACNAVCFAARRIRFLSDDGVTKNAPLQGQMIMYYGKNASGFIEKFSNLGVVMLGVAND